MKAPSDTARARILVVDDHAFMRVAMGAILGKDEILEVVGEAKDGEEAHVGTQTEGCVADDEFGYFYVGEEDIGIWKYGAEPDAGAERILVDSTGSTGHLVLDVERLTISYSANSTGYLLASSQGNSSFAAYKREGGNDYVKTFKIEPGSGIDRVEQTDGIDVTTMDLGPNFPSRAFIAQDGKNDNGYQNFKLVPYQRIFPSLP
jgi:3-phytase